MPQKPDRWSRRGRARYRTEFGAAGGQGNTSDIYRSAPPNRIKKRNATWPHVAQSQLVLPEELQRQRRVTPRYDFTLQARRHVLRRLFAISEKAPIRWLLGRTLRATMPAVALAAGEELVSQARKVLAFTAHPDDLEFFAGGVLRRMCLNGSEVHAVLLTDGEKRGNFPHLAAIRRAEQRLAGRLQGYASIQMHALPDFGLPEDARLEEVVANSFQRISPQVVFAFDPQELVARMANRDHKALGRAVMDAARSWVGKGVRVYFYGTRQPNTLVNVTDVMEDKVRAVEAHASQLIYLTRKEHRRAVALLSRAWAHQSGVSFAEGLYRLI